MRNPHIWHFGNETAGISGGSVERKVRLPGFEPESMAWEATVLTTGLQSLKCGNWFQRFNPNEMAKFRAFPGFTYLYVVNLEGINGLVV